MSRWNIFFLLSAAIFFIGGIVFLLFAEGEPLAWGSSSTTIPQASGPSEGITGTDTDNQTTCTASRHRSQSFHTDVCGVSVGSIQKTQPDCVYESVYCGVNIGEDGKSTKKTTKCSKSESSE
ncbi:hypothetical protein PoB_007166100 [Plakobranchus ocellatus]|uniref:Uncharacterized protein n=1 Tax=Plakobranchus ocellatus TaxID=259542 RepID=A0AAV4DLX7_9GAST|nr:hypothetical protein PoB_007166100 [Plakobranchus ocellatus]